MMVGILGNVGKRYLIVVSCGLYYFAQVIDFL